MKKYGILRNLWLWVVTIIFTLFPTIALAVPVTLIPRPNSTVPITTLPTLRWQNISNTWGGNTTTTTGPNFGMLIYNAILVYSDSIGMIVYVIFFAIPFLMMWIVQSDMTLPAIVGILFSFYIFTKLPEQYILFSVGCFAIAFAALLWSLYKRGY